MDLTIILIEQGNRCTELHISGDIYLPAVFNTHYNETKDAYIFICCDKGSPYRLAKLMCGYGYHVNFERRQAGMIPIPVKYRIKAVSTSGRGCVEK